VGTQEAGDGTSAIVTQEDGELKAKFDPLVHKRKTIRLRGYDYGRPGGYFVTACTRDREPLFGEIVSCEQPSGQPLVLNEYGRIVSECWLWLAKQYPCVELDEWIVMPNHLHGILIISDGRGGGDSRIAPTKPLGRLIGAFKTVSARRINELRSTPGAPVWKRDFYDHVIRDEADLNRIRQYVAYNPFNWADDDNNPCRGGSRTAPTSGTAGDPQNCTTMAPRSHHER
jgi:REP element-mobilizing transposase RayT